jgi:hypothetical protein
MSSHWNRFVLSTAAAFALVLSGAVLHGTAQRADAFAFGQVTIESSAVDQGNGTWLYSYTIDNEGGISVATVGPGAVNAMVIPLLEGNSAVAGGLGGVTAPTGWLAEFTSSIPFGALIAEPDDNFDEPLSNFTSASSFLYFHTVTNGEIEPLVNEYPEVEPGETLGGFSFLSPLGPIEGPVFVGFTGLQPAAVDPRIPGRRVVDGAIPEPVTAGTLALAGLAIVGHLTRRKRA